MSFAPPRHRVPLLLLVLLLLTPPMLGAQEQADDGRTLHWRELTVQAHLDAEGRLEVRERQAMVFDGAWNGGERGFDLRLGQELEFHRLMRIDPATGAGTPLVRGDLEVVDEFDWVDGGMLRWRIRLPSDPPFEDREIVYQLDYTLWPVLVPLGGGEYQLRHDFAFPDRAGVIERFSVELTVDPAWSGPAGGRVVESADRLPPGRGYTVSVPLRYVAEGQPTAPATGAPGWVRVPVVLGALLVPLLLFLRLRRRDEELDRIAPLTEADTIDEEWLRTHIFTHPAEVVGASWDRSVGEAEVAALLARLVEEGKLTSRVDSDGEEPVLHLTRVAPLSDFPDHERDLLEALFFDGSEHTDTASIREHYKKKGFDPAAEIREALTERLDALPGAGSVTRSWLPGVVVILAGVGVAVALTGVTRGLEVGLLGVLVAVVTGGASVASAAILARRVTHRNGPRVGVLLPLVILSAMLTVLASGVFEGEGGMLFYRPGPALLIGLLIVLAGFGWLAAALSQPTETPERLGFRRRLVSAREFFEAELTRPEPRLQDAWFPYLLAFGLGTHVDRWFREFSGRRSHGAGAVIVATGTHSGGGSSGGWSGGGPQFGGGGGFGGGGAGGAWSVAAAGMAAGVSPPSSGGAGGGASSGGGSGGGW